MPLTDLSSTSLTPGDLGMMSGLDIATGGGLFGNSSSSSSSSDNDSDSFEAMAKRLEGAVHDHDYGQALDDLPEASNMTLPGIT